MLDLGLLALWLGECQRCRATRARRQEAVRSEFFGSAAGIWQHNHLMSANTLE
jgi:hypothetical protein